MSTEGRAPAQAPQAERQKRLAEALRANLKRRKVRLRKGKAARPEPAAGGRQTSETT